MEITLTLTLTLRNNPLTIVTFFLLFLLLLVNSIPSDCYLPLDQLSHPPIHREKCFRSFPPLRPPFAETLLDVDPFHETVERGSRY